MKKTIDHLPELKQKELNRIVSIIKERCNDIEMIILYGSYARGDFKKESDMNEGRRSSHKSDYTILAIPKNKPKAKDVAIWQRITEKCNQAGLSTQVRIIAHDIGEVNTNLAEGQYFFSDIKKDGCLLFDSGNFKLARNVN